MTIDERPLGIFPLPEFRSEDPLPDTLRELLAAETGRLVTAADRPDTVAAIVRRGRVWQAALLAVTHPFDGIVELAAMRGEGGAAAAGRVRWLVLCNSIRAIINDPDTADQWSGLPQDGIALSPIYANVARLATALCVERAESPLMSDGILAGLAAAALMRLPAPQRTREQAMIALRDPQRAALIREAASRRLFVSRERSREQ